MYKFCKKNEIGFLALEYSGHGKSYGKFEDGTITSWTQDAKNNKKKIKSKKLILVGSSMGAWIGLNLLSIFKKFLRLLVLLPHLSFWIYLCGINLLTKLRDI